MPHSVFHIGQYLHLVVNHKDDLFRLQTDKTQIGILFKYRLLLAFLMQQNRISSEEIFHMHTAYKTQKMYTLSVEGLETVVVFIIMLMI